LALGVFPSCDVIDEFLVQGEAGMVVIVDDDVAQQAAGVRLDHVEPATHHRQDAQHHCDAQRDRRDREVGDPPFAQVT
jgi:hypothetical protein